jgi:hypothetical protein
MISIVYSGLGTPELATLYHQCKKFFKESDTNTAGSDVFRGCKPFFKECDMTLQVKEASVKQKFVQQDKKLDKLERQNVKRQDNIIHLHVIIEQLKADSVQSKADNVQLTTKIDQLKKEFEDFKESMMKLLKAPG